MTIPFHESISLKNVNDKTQFVISDNSEEFHLQGKKINDYIFEKPGVYRIKIIDFSKNKKENCESTKLPKEILLTVSRIKMIFDGKNVTFSEPIHKNKDTSNSVLSIPVTIITYDHQPVTLNTTPVNSAGIGTSIVASLIDSKKVLYEGTHILKYSLSGMVTQNAYLMFDFIDANNKIQSVSLVTPIQD